MRRSRSVDAALEQEVALPRSRAAILKYMRLHQADDRETIIGYDAATERIFLPVFGLRDRVPLSSEMSAAISDPAGRVTLHHNHPGGDSFSLQDLQLMAGRPGLYRLFVHAPDGTRFSASRRDALSIERIRDARDIVAEEMEADVKRGDLAREIWRLYLHLVGRTLGALDLVDYGAELKAGTKSLYDAHAKRADALVARAVRRLR